MCTGFFKTVRTLLLKLMKRSAEVISTKRRTTGNDGGGWILANNMRSKSRAGIIAGRVTSREFGKLTSEVELEPQS